MPNLRAIKGAKSGPTAATSRVVRFDSMPKHLRTTKALVAVMFSGQWRALEHVYPTISRYVTAPFGGLHVSFLYITPEPPCDGKLCRRGSVPRSGTAYKSSLSEHIGEWGNISDTQVHSAMHSLPCGGYLVYGDRPQPLPSLCKRGGTFAKHWQQFDKMQRAFELVLLYERLERVRFDWLLRLRTDAYFFAPLPHHSTLDDAVHLPYGMTTSMSLNDQLAIVSRRHADSYFNLADELFCRNDWSGAPLANGSGARPSLGALVDSSDGGLLLSRLRRWQAPVRLHAIGYTLVRPSRPPGGYAYDCGRLLKKHVPQTRTFYAPCMRICGRASQSHSAHWGYSTRVSRPTGHGSLVTAARSTEARPAVPVAACA